MSFIPVLQYIVGLGIFGFLWWLTNGIVSSIVVVGVHKSGDVWELMQYVWLGIIFIYLIFGGIWLVRKYNEVQYKVEG